MSLKTYYSAILAQRKSGVPTVEEARRDFREILARLVLV
jgi:hypothetical protein